MCKVQPGSLVRLKPTALFWPGVLGAAVHGTPIKVGSDILLVLAIKSSNMDALSFAMCLHNGISGSVFLDNIQVIVV